MWYHIGIICISSILILFFIAFILLFNKTIRINKIEDAFLKKTNICILVLNIISIITSILLFFFYYMSESKDFFESNPSLSLVQVILILVCPILIVFYFNKVLTRNDDTLICVDNLSIRTTLDFNLILYSAFSFFFLGSLINEILYFILA